MRCRSEVSFLPGRCVTSGWRAGPTDSPSCSAGCTWRSSLRRIGPADWLERELQYRTHDPIIELEPGRPGSAA